MLKKMICIRNCYNQFKKILVKNLEYECKIMEIVLFRYSDNFFESGMSSSGGPIGRLLRLRCKFAFIDPVRTSKSPSKTFR